LKKKRAKVAVFNFSNSLSILTALYIFMLAVGVKMVGRGIVDDMDASATSAAQY